MINTYFLKKLSSIHSSLFTFFSSCCSSIPSVCIMVHTAAGRERKQGHRENVDWIFSDVGVLYMNKWNGLDNDALKGLSLPYTIKWRETDRFMITIKWIMTGYMIIYLNSYSGHFILNFSALFFFLKRLKKYIKTPNDATIIQYNRMTTSVILLSYNSSTSTFY